MEYDGQYPPDEQFSLARAQRVSAGRNLPDRSAHNRSCPLSVSLPRTHPVHGCETDQRIALLLRSAGLPLYHRQPGLKLFHLRREMEDQWKPWVPLAGEHTQASPMVLRLKSRRDLPSSFLLKLELKRLYDALWDEVPEDVIQISLSRALGFADGVWKPFRYTEEDNMASISGVVYLDINANGRFDKADKPLSAIRIRLDGSTTTSNEHGEYLFANLDPGIYRVEFHLPSLPANYTPVTGPQLIRLREQENFFIDFAVTANGSVSGKVFIDRNANGIQDGDEEPVSWVGVILDDGAQQVFTSEDGRFYFEGVPLGTHALTLNRTSLPTNLETVGHDVKTFTLTEESLEVSGLDFPLLHHRLTARSAK